MNLPKKIECSINRTTRGFQHRHEHLGRWIQCVNEGNPHKGVLMTVHKCLKEKEKKWYTLQV